MKKAKKNYYKGIFTEYLVIIYLFSKGYKILKHRYKNKLGEIDLIVKKNNIIIFVEIKYRKSVQDFLDAVTAKQKIRISRSSHLFLKKILYPCEVRYDLILVHNIASINHIKNAFYAHF